MRKGFWYRFLDHIANLFKGWSLAWQVVAMILTWVIVVSGTDWSYFTALRDSNLFLIFIPAAFIGFLFPIVIPLIMLYVGKKRSSKRLISAAWGTGQAAFIGLLFSSFYKFFTGRLQPPQTLKPIIPLGTDISHGFRFGFGRGGVFWGWPSSHTTVAFAAAVALIYIYPEKKWVKVLALACAVYIGLGVSFTIHWLSEAVAGVIFGSIVGMTVGKSFFDENVALA